MKNRETSSVYQKIFFGPKYISIFNKKVLADYGMNFVCLSYIKACRWK